MLSGNLAGPDRFGLDIDLDLPVWADYSYIVNWDTVRRQILGMVAEWGHCAQTDHDEGKP
jgi:hypothetical protein